MDKRMVITGIVVLILLGVLYRGLLQDPSAIRSPMMDQAMPAFTAYTTDTQHQLVNNETLQGKPYLLNIWASWCSSCVMEHQRWMAYSQTTHLPLMGVVYNDTMTKATAWLSQHGNPYTALIDDPKGRLVIDLGVYGTPETILVDGKGIIRKRFIGPINQAWLTQISKEYAI